MYFTVDRKEIFDAVKRVTKALCHGVGLPVLNSIRIEAKREGFVLLTAGDMQHFYTVSVPCELQEPGEGYGGCLVDARFLRRTIELCEEDSRITFVVKPTTRKSAFGNTINENTLSIISGEAAIRPAMKSAEEYPTLPKICFNEARSISSKDLRRALKSVFFCTAREEEVREALVGIQFEFAALQFRAMATDGRRGASLTSKGFSEELRSLKFILPRRTCRLLAEALVGTDDGTVDVAFGGEIESESLHGNIIQFTLSKNGDFHSRIQSRLITTGRFPELKQIVPKSFDTRITVRRSDIVRAVKQCRLVFGTLAYTAGQSCEIETQRERGLIGDCLRFSSTTEYTFGHSVDSTVSAIIQGGDTERISFNVHYLLEAVSQFRCEEILISRNDSLSMLKVEGVDAETGQPQAEFFTLLMPTRIKQREEG